MNKRFSKIIGVAVTLAMLSSLIVAPMAGALSQPTVTLATANNSISLVNADYTIRFSPGTQLKGGSAVLAAPGAWALPDIGDTITFTATTQGDVVTLPTTGGTIPTLTLAGGATVAAGPPAVITFNAVGATATATATAVDTIGTWAQTAQTAAATVSAGAGAYTLPVVGDTLTFTSALATDVVTLTLTTGTVSVAMSGTGTYAAGVITFAAAAEVATVTCVTAGAGTWAQTAGGPTVTAASARAATTAAGSGANTITITFPYNTGITAGAIAGATIVASPGWVDNVWTDANVDDVTWVGTAYNVLTGAAAKIVGTLGNTQAILADADTIGEGADVRITFTNGITNPATIGDYTLTVKTSATGDTTAVTSASYAIAAPTVAALPGIGALYNSAGVEMASRTGTTAIAELLALAAGMTGSSIKLGPGTYTENITTNAISQTIEATGTAAETIVIGTVTVNTPSATIQGLTLKAAVGGGTLLTIGAAGDKATIQNNVFVKGGTSTINADVAGETIIAYNNAVASSSVAGYGTITNNTFDTTKMYYWAYRVNDTVIDANWTGLTISNNTFTVDSTTTTTVGGTDDIAIDASAGALYYPITVSGNTITGSSGTGIRVTAGYTNISTTTMSSLGQAILVNGAGAIVSVADSTISDCGVGINLANGYAGVPAVEVTAAGGLTITNTTISGSVNDIMEVTANGNNIIVMFNDLRGNALGFDNNDLTNTLNVTNNLWNDDGSGPPATLFNAGLVNAVPAQGSSGTGAVTTTAVSGRLTAQTTAGVDVEVTLASGAAWAVAAGSMIAVANYPANPQSDTPLAALEGGFYDVYFVDTNAGAAAAASILVKFYNANISATTEVYVWSELQGIWVPVSAVNALGVSIANQGVNSFGGFVWVRISGLSTPTILNLSGTPFALVEPEVVAAPDPTVPGASALLAPEFGDIAAPIQPTFTWTAAVDAVSYEFVLAEEIGQDDKFAIIDYSATTDINGHVAREQLKYDRVYNWRVRAVNAVGAGAWTTGFFTTVSEPVPEPEPVPPVEIKEVTLTPAAPEIILNVPPATKQEVQVIPDYLLWVVIAVGAVLIIAVVVLIVRTRRVT